MQGDGRERSWRPRSHSDYLLGTTSPIILLWFTNNAGVFLEMADIFKRKASAKLLTTMAISFCYMKMLRPAGMWKNVINVNAKLKFDFALLIFTSNTAESTSCGSNVPPGVKLTGLTGIVLKNWFLFQLPLLKPGISSFTFSLCYAGNLLEDG